MINVVTSHEVAAIACIPSVLDGRFCSPITINESNGARGDRDDNLADVKK